MVYFAERRKYQRCTNLVCTVLVNSEGYRWDEVGLCDISAGGLKFSSVKSYEIGIPLKFDLTIFNMLSEFNLKFEGHIVRITKDGDKSNYSVKFDSINKYSQVQLDEIIKSKVSVDSMRHSAAEDGIYTFPFITKARTYALRHKIHIRR